jgi:hypothetical protein
MVCKGEGTRCGCCPGGSWQVVGLSGSGDPMITPGTSDPMITPGPAHLDNPVDPCPCGSRDGSVQATHDPSCQGLSKPPRVAHSIHRLADLQHHHIKPPTATSKPNSCSAGPRAQAELVCGLACRTKDKSCGGGLEEVWFASHQQATMPSTAAAMPSAAAAVAGTGCGA